MKKIALILLVMAVFISLAMNDSMAQSQTPLEGECYLMIMNNLDVRLKEVVLNGQIIGKLSADGIFMKKFQCGAETVSVELCLDKTTFLTKEIQVERWSTKTKPKSPINFFIWKVSQ